MEIEVVERLERRRAEHVFVRAGIVVPVRTVSIRPLQATAGRSC